MRRLLLLVLLALAGPALGAPYLPVRPGVPLRFPADHGAHPGFRTEWWYVTGWLDTPQGPKGFQLTFFAVTPPLATARPQRQASPPPAATERPQTGALPSRFALKQVVFAHAALADPAHGRLRHAGRIARTGFGLAEARVGDMDLTLDGWRLWRAADGRLHARVDGDGFALDLVLSPAQPVLLQGRAGFSQKGPSLSEASHYYSWPHLKLSGRLGLGGRWQQVKGSAWLDREWSSTLLNPRAVGWDWLGLNLDDGGALTLFRVRDGRGGAVWAGGSHRDASGKVNIFNREDVKWQAGGWWQSPRSRTRWPVQPVVEYRLGGRWQRITVTPLMPDQELDSRASGGPLYWEGAVKVPPDPVRGRQGGRGYLELTGYAAPLRM